MKKIRASKCEIREVPAAEQRAFLNKNHIQGYTPCSLCLGLYLGDELVYLQSYGKTRRSNIDYVDWDMKRMCGPKDAYVYGGASKLLKYFLNNYDLGKGLVTYCDPEVFDGHTYEKIGFTLDHICPDDYKYIKDGVEYSKQHGKKSNIWARLKKYNPEIEPFDVWKTKHTEREMMEKLGYERVMHKGLIAYVIMGNPKWYIYDIEINGYHYVGQHVYYKSLNDNYYGSGIVLKNMQNKYHTNGNKTILCYGLKDKMAADTAEKVYISASRKKYGELHKGGKNINIADGGQGGNFAPWTEERKKKIAESQNGKKLSEEHKKKISDSLKGRPGPNKGRKMSEEQKILISSKLKGRNAPYEMTDSIRKKMSDAKKDKPSSRKGQSMSENGVQNIKDGWKKRKETSQEHIHSSGHVTRNDIIQTYGVSRYFINTKLSVLGYYKGVAFFDIKEVDQTINGQNKESGLKKNFKEQKQDPKSQPRYRLIRCIETGEEYGQNEWVRMGYSHAGQIARGYGRCKSDHGKHFEFVE